MGKIRTGIAGTGYTVGIAANHVRGYQANPDCDLVALTDIIPGRAETWAKEKGLSVQICGTYDELLDRVDAVSICTPNYAHVPMAVRAMERGKHILCEKPISVSAAEAAPALRMAKSVDTVAMIGFSYRGIPALRLMKRLIDQGKLGTVFSYRETLGGCRIANPQVKLEWRMQKELSGSGALADFGCHMLDLCDWLLRVTAGRMAEACGMAAVSLESRDNIRAPGRGPVTNDDTSAFQVRLENGALASFLASRLGVARHTLEVYGSGGMMLFRDDRPEELEVWFKQPDGGYSGAAEILRAPDELITTPWFNAEIDAFIDAVKHGKKPDRSFARAVEIQQIIDRILAACETGETVSLYPLGQ